MRDGRFAYSLPAAQKMRVTWQPYYVFTPDGYGPSLRSLVKSTKLGGAPIADREGSIPDTAGQ